MKILQEYTGLAGNYYWNFSQCTKILLTLKVCTFVPVIDHMLCA